MKIWWPRVISNEKLWEKTGQIKIDMEIRKRKFRWIGHRLHKHDSKSCKAALQWSPQGTRGRARYLWRWNTLKECGKRSWSNLRFIARDWEGWRFVPDGTMYKCTVLCPAWTQMLVLIWSLPVKCLQVWPLTILGSASPTYQTTHCTEYPFYPWC
jgi:hypothetical protein